MEIRKAEMTELEEILKLYVQARQFMKENGNPDQWGDDYPPREQTEEDIRSGNCYVCEEEGELLGVFFYCQEDDPDYKEIYEGSWIGRGPYGVMHRVACPKGRRGAATFCVSWCVARCGDLRIDTHQDNLPMQRMLEKNGFVRCGIIHPRIGGDRIAYEKVGNYDKM